MFDSAKLKLERAEHHIADLKRETEIFMLAKPYTCAISNDSKTGKVFVEIILKTTFPNVIPAAIGDAIHNLRCVLDHVTWELIGWDGGKQNRHTKFPIGANRTSYEAACNGLETPSACINELMVCFEAFPEGRGEFLYILNRLNNADKHRVITPIVSATQIPDFAIIKADGTTLMQMIGNTTLISAKTRTAITNVPAGTHIEFPNGTDCPVSIFLREGSEGDAFRTLEEFQKAVSIVIEYAENCVSANSKAA